MNDQEFEVKFETLIAASKKLGYAAGLRHAARRVQQSPNVNETVERLLLQASREALQALSELQAA